MDQKDWLILQILSEEKNITRAAKRLFLSQPSLTYRLQQMEQEFGVKIVDRSKRGVIFTLEGQYLVEVARQMLAKLEHVKDYIASMSKEVQGVLKLGVSSNYAYYMLPGILRSFLNEYPKVKISLKTGWSTEIMELLHQDEIHIGIQSSSSGWQERSDLVSEEKICVISKEPIELDHLTELPRIIYTKNPTLEQEIRNWWQTRYNKPPLITLQVDYVETCKKMVLHGLGYAIVPESCIHPGDDLHIIHLTSEDGRYLVSKTWMHCRNSSLKLSVVKKFFDFVNSRTNHP